MRDGPIESRPASPAGTHGPRRAPRPVVRRARGPIHPFGYRALGVLLALTLAFPVRASAQLEVEADPFAYALNGFSLHVAGISGAYRLSIGAFGIDVPQWLHDHDDWSVSMRGFGIKADLLGSRTGGFFVGTEAGVYRVSYTLDGAGETEKRNESSVGIRGGFRLPIGRGGLYLAPWVGIGYTFGAGDPVIAGETFERNPISLVPTVHIGWRF